MHEITLGSLFDGSGGFPLGGLLCGITPVWASEIEPFPIRVTTKRLPYMKHYGDISSINGAEVEPVDIITFGSPCTDMSVAGKRAGLDGSQSVLFYEAIRIIKEMRRATDGRYPKYAVWENVPGAFSSNNGADFKAVLDALIQIAEPAAEVPAPENGRWPYADVFLGDGWSVAYRTLDAQYFGVPQRRRRIFLVASFGNERAPDILFKSEGVSGYPPQGGLPWQRTAGYPEECAGSSGCGLVLNDQGGSNMAVSHEVTATLRAEEHGHQPIVFEPGAVSRIGGHAWSDTAGTIRADMGDNQLAVALENHPTDGRIRIEENGKVQTLTSRMGTGGMNVPLVMNERQYALTVREDVANTLTSTDYKGTQCVFEPKAYGICSDGSNSMKSSNPHSGIYEADTARTLDANGGNPGCNQGGIAIVEPDNHQLVYALQGSMIGRDGQNGPQGDGINEDVCFTLTGPDRHAAAYAMTVGGHPEVHAEYAATLTARDYKDPQIVNTPQSGDQANNEYVVRRLTPSECARLQGFPPNWCSNLETVDLMDREIDWWAGVFETHRKIMGTSTKPKSRKQIEKWLQNPHGDAAEYKMWGNGVALPCVCFVLAGIAWVENE